MEKKTIRCSNQFKDKLVEYYSLFGYHLENEDDLLFSRKKYVFVREEVNEKVKSMESKYHLYPFLSYIPVATACVIIAILASLFLVFSFRGSGDRFTYFLSFMIPVFILLPLIAVYTYVRYYFDSKNIDILLAINDIKKDLED